MFCYDILPFIKEELSKLSSNVESATQEESQYVLSEGKRYVTPGYA